jgi:C-terminal processing protease CtpA/Prc
MAHRLRFLAFVALALLRLAPVLAQPTSPAAPPLANPGFEEGETGQAPPGWVVPPPGLAAGYTIRLAEEKPEAGRRCLEIALPGVSQDSRAFGNAMQSLDAKPLRGQRVRFSAAARVEGAAGAAGKAQLWMRVDREKGQPGFFDNMGDRPVASATWARYEIVGDVAADAESLHLGFFLPGGGRAWLDSATFEVLGEAGAGNEPARPLSSRGIENLAAFARLFGVVRFFHPSDQATAADWTAVALAGVQRVEDADGPEALARTLEELFRPIAPTVQVYPAGPKPPLPAALAKPGDGAGKILAWRHVGVGLSPGPGIYNSLRVDDQDSALHAPALLWQEIEPAPFLGKKIRFRAAVRTELAPGRQARLALRIFRSGQPKPLETEIPGDSLGSGPWRFVDVQGDVPADALGILAGLELDGPGTVWIDDAVLGTVDGKTTDAEQVMNPSFETGDEGFPPDDWDLEGDTGGFTWTRSAEQPYSGRFSGRLASVDAKAGIPSPAEPWTAELGGGVSAAVPLALWADAAGTLPHLDSGSPPPAPTPAKPAGFLPSGDDRATRLADVVLAWNVFQHFYPYFDVAGTDWPAVLRSSLRDAATAPDSTAFGDVLRRLVAALQDGHGQVSSSKSGQSTPALALDWIEDQLVVAWADPARAEGVQAGDTVLSVDGQPARQAIEAAEALISGATPQWRRFRAVSELTAGAPGGTMRLEIQPLAGPPRTVAVARNLPVYGPGSLYEERAKKLPEKIAELRPGLYYVDLSRISDGDFQGALDKLAAARGVVFDLRGYPGGLSPAFLQHLTDRPLHSAQWQVPVTSRPDRQGVTWHLSRWTLPPLAPRLRGKIAFLTGGGAISYAESCLGIVEAYQLADIVGGPTAGTNGNINPFTLPGGYWLSWTGMRVIKHDGSRHHGVGIRPTVPVAPTRRGVAAGRDEVLEKGLEVASR